jgi:hypothetical protein
MKTGPSRQTKNTARGKRKQAYKEQAADFLFYGTNQLRTLLTNLLAPLAAQSVKPGDHWSGPVMLRLEGLMELAGTYTFKGLNGGVCTLQAEARRSMDDQPIGPPPPPAEEAHRVKLAGTYQATIKVDRATGSLLSKEAVMELKGTAPMPNARTRTFGDPVPITTKATVAVEPVATIQTITASPNPAPVSTAVTVGAAFSDPGPGDKHEAMWDWGDGTSSPGTVVREPSGSGNGNISGSHIYTGRRNLYAQADHHR